VGRRWRGEITAACLLLRLLALLEVYCFLWASKHDPIELKGKDVWVFVERYEVLLEAFENTVVLSFVTIYPS